MGKIGLHFYFLLAVFILQGCTQGHILVLDDVELLRDLPISFDEKERVILDIIPKGEKIPVIGHAYGKDFLVYKVRFNGKVGYVLFDGLSTERLSDP
jgi:hypothetical protein